MSAGRDCGGSGGKVVVKKMRRGSAKSGQRLSIAPAKILRRTVDKQTTAANPSRAHLRFSLKRDNTSDSGSTLGNSAQ